MNDSTRSDKSVSEGTEALQQIAEEVEREREERGGSEFDPPAKPDEQLMADEAAHSADNPDLDEDTREDHATGSDDTDGRAERGAEDILRIPPHARGVS
ncbi:hypothetical protein LGT39_03245 [Demequina sp. TTPB684]|uniref:hypothetical protein n=1 Tax=unclassified Demequina TaxID=2620311 RepID=UPI001CF1CDF3|nr:MULTISPECIES: hypothetical protein [unclassified Demequina]MCB2411866.1 hypothetical protein [Demequina sp. TTPB684]UPU88620.1 hypothetical protein LGT36_001475 [Demequina sp. TMPB413]